MIQESNADVLAASVQEAIAEGWQPIGGVAIANLQSPNGNFDWYCQAVTRQPSTTEDAELAAWKEKVLEILKTLRLERERQKTVEPDLPTADDLPPGESWLLGVMEEYREQLRERVQEIIEAEAKRIDREIMGDDKNEPRAHIPFEVSKSNGSWSIVSAGGQEIALAYDYQMANRIAELLYEHGL